MGGSDDSVVKNAYLFDACVQGRLNVRMLREDLAQAGILGPGVWTSTVAPSHGIGFDDASAITPPLTLDTLTAALLATAHLPSKQDQAAAILKRLYPEGEA